MSVVQLRSWLKCLSANLSLSLSLSDKSEYFHAKDEFLSIE